MEISPGGLELVEDLGDVVRVAIGLEVDVQRRVDRMVQPLCINVWTSVRRDKHVTRSTALGRVRRVATKEQVKEVRPG